MIVHAVKINRQSLPFIIFREHGALPVPACPARKEAGFRLVLSGKLLIHTEIMGNLDIFPAGIVEFFLVRVLHITKIEFPTGIKVSFIRLRFRHECVCLRCIRLPCLLCCRRNACTSNDCDSRQTRCQAPRLHFLFHKLFPPLS